MSTALQLDTHEIFNQSPPYEDIDLFSTDAPLVDAVRANGAGGETAALCAFGRQWGTAEMFALGRRANEIRRSSAPSTRRAFAATSSSSIRPTTS